MILSIISVEISILLWLSCPIKQYLHAKLQILEGII